MPSTNTDVRSHAEAAANDTGAAQEGEEPSTQEEGEEPRTQEDGEERAAEEEAGQGDQESAGSAVTDSAAPPPADQPDTSEENDTESDKRKGTGYLRGRAWRRYSQPDWRTGLR